MRGQSRAGENKQEQSRREESSRNSMRSLSSPGSSRIKVESAVGGGSLAWGPVFCQHTVLALLASSSLISHVNAHRCDSVQVSAGNEDD